MPLTELTIKNAKAQGKPYTLTDGGGLGIEISPAGGKLWRWRYRYNSKAQVLALGKYPAVSLAQARKLRDEARELVNMGQHPTRIKQAQKLRRIDKCENTFESVARRWHSLREAKLNKKYHNQILTRMEQHVFPVIGTLPISEITIPDIVKTIEKIGDRGTIITAKRMKQYVSQVYLLERKKMMQDYADILDGIRTGKNAAVVQIRKEAKKRANA